MRAEGGQRVRVVRAFLQLRGRTGWWTGEFGEVGDGEGGGDFGEVGSVDVDGLVDDDGLWGWDLDGS